jgi:hypothetical protein
MKAAYAAIGYHRPRAARFIQIKESKRHIRYELMMQIAARFESAGIKAEWQAEADRLLLAGSWILALTILHCYIANKYKSPNWSWYRPKGQFSDWEVFVRMEVGNQAIKDMFLVSQNEVEALPKALTLSAQRFSPYRIVTLDQIVQRTLVPTMSVDPKVLHSAQVPLQLSG